MFNTSTFSLKKILTLILITACICTCKNEIKPIAFKTVVIKNTYEADIEVAFDNAKVNSEIGESINSHINTAILKSIPILDDEIPHTIEDALKNFDENYISFKNDFEDSEQTWVLTIETEILYKTENIITIALSVYSDTGGAHGNDTIQFLNFNPKTGTLLAKKDIISDMDGFKELAKSYFLNTMKNEGSDISEFFFGKPFQLPEHIGFNDDGVILLYNIYEIASYNQGYTEFVMPWSSAQKFLKL